MSNPNWTAMTTYKCGCEVREVRLPRSPLPTPGRRYRLHYTIHWCPKHDRALRMYDLLLQIVEEEMADGDPEKLEAALCKAAHLLEEVPR